MTHKEFVEGYKKGTVRLGVVPSKIHIIPTSPVYDSFLSDFSYPRKLNRIATLLSILIIPFLISIVVTVIMWKLWFSALFTLIVLVLIRKTYVLQREAVRQLALADEKAYTFLLLEGTVVVDPIIKG